MFGIDLGLFSLAAAILCIVQLSDGSPVVTLTNGTYSGIYSPEFNQDIFLGMPFAKPPTGISRLQIPESLNTTWSGSRPAMAFGNSCPQYSF